MRLFFEANKDGFGSFDEFQETVKELWKRRMDDEEWIKV
jgi:hypothetical protein